MRRFLLALLCCGCSAKVLPPVDAGPTLPPVLAHAHNDYEHPRPLLDALDQRFDSVEADLYWSGTDLGISHGGPPFKGTLKELYLEPLKALVEKNGGSVRGDGKPFFLWLDFKDSLVESQDAVAAQLAGYPMLTRFEDDREVPGAVTVVLTGTAAAKKALADRAAPRFWIRDSNNYADTDPASDLRWGYYAVSYWTFLSWAGDGAMPAAQKKQLKNLIDGAHAKGRKLRIYSSPDAPEYWRAARELGLDFLNADDLAGLRATLDAP
ncbi:MAG: putative secreted protein [Myxococcaceae bacterium]|nr:putative secreted protein [Myxococcaceae bacterium]